MMETPRLRPLSLVEILDQAFRFYRRGFFTFLPILAVVYVPVSVALMAFYATHPEAFTSEDPRQAKLLESIQRLLDAAVSGFTISIAVGAITRAIGDMYLGEAPPSRSPGSCSTTTSGSARRGSTWRCSPRRSPGG